MQIFKGENIKKAQRALIASSEVLNNGMVSKSEEEHYFLVILFDKYNINPQKLSPRGHQKIL